MNDRAMQSNFHQPSALETTTAGKRTFNDSLYQTLWIATAIPCAILVVTWIAMGGAKLGAATSIAILGGQIAVLVAIVWVIAGFTVTTRTLICDAAGCEVIVSARWRRAQTFSFQWKDVTDVYVRQTVKGSGRYRSEYLHLNVALGGSEIELLRKHNLSPRQFEELMSLVSAETPQLNYFWVSREKAGQSLQTLENVAGYIKVARA